MNLASRGTLHFGRTSRFNRAASRFPARLEALAEDFHAEAVLVEEKASGQSLLQSLKQETSLPVVGIPADTDKISRAHAVNPLFESGRIFFPVNERWMADYLHELELFPSSKFNDQVDSTTQALTYLRSRTYGGGILGVVKMLQKMANRGEPAYKAPAAVLTEAGGQVVSVRDKPAKCPLCGGPRIWMSHGMDPIGWWTFAIRTGVRMVCCQIPKIIMRARTFLASISL